MEVLIYIYYVLMLVCFIASLQNLKNDSIRLLSVLLFVSIVTEILVEYSGKDGRHYYLYHPFSLIEYSIVTLIVRRNILNRGIRKAMLLSVPLFFTIASLIYFKVQQGTEYPSLIGTIENSALTIWSLIGLFSIDPKEPTPLLHRTFFWFCLAFLVYYSGTIAVNGVYNYLLKTKSQDAKILYSIINSIFNYLLYGFLTTGIILSKWKQRS